MKAACAVFLFFATSANAWALPKIAVLDAMIPKGMDSSVVVPATDKICERLVGCGRFTVLDRTNIESVLKEREFQLSGMVSDQEIANAGKYLGADFVVVPNVQRIENTYFVGARMIEVKTGIIYDQASAEGEGTLRIVLDLADQVGTALAGGRSPVRAGAARPAPAAPRAPAEDKLKGRLLASLGGSAVKIGFPGGVGDIDVIGTSFDCHLFLPLFGGLFAAANLDGVIFEEASALEADIIFDIVAGAGFAAKMGRVVVFADFKAGATQGNIHRSGDDTFDGPCFGSEGGIDLYLGKAFVLGLRLQYHDAKVDFSDVSRVKATTISFFASAGFRF